MNTILERVLKLQEERGVSDADLCRGIGISSAQYSTWKGRRTEPPAKYIEPLARFFRVPEKYILTGRNIMDYIELDEVEELILFQFRQMDNDHKDMVRSMCQFLLDDCNNKKRKADTSGNKVG